MIELDGEKYLDGDEASNFLGVKMSTLYAYVSRGILLGAIHMIMHLLDR